MGLFGKRKVKKQMDEHEMYEVQLEDSGERLEKKEQLRAKVQALVSYYEDEKRRNEELTMELERLKAEQQQMQSITGPVPGMPGAMPPMSPPAPGMSPPAAPGMNPGAAPGGIPFAQRPQNGFQPQQGFPPPGMPGGAPAAPAMPEFQPQPPQAPQAPGGYTLQNFGAGFAPQPPRPPMPQNPYGAPAPWQQQPQQGMPNPQSPYGAPPAPWQQPQPPAQPFGQPGFPQNPFGAAPPWQQPQQPQQAPAYPQQNDALTESLGLVLQTITQVRAKLHQSESIRGYGYPPQPAYVDYDTVALLDKLYDQLGDLSRELMQRQGR